MNYGIERTCAHPPGEMLEAEAAAQQFDISVGELQQYTREGVLIALRTADGRSCYTRSDYRWVVTLHQLLVEAHLSYQDIRQQLAACACWKMRRCGFQAKLQCPLTKDMCKPCWMNRAMCSVLCSYPCYSCVVYRAAPNCEGIKAALCSSALMRLSG